MPKVKKVAKKVAKPAAKPEPTPVLLKPKGSKKPVREWSSSRDEKFAK